jgi:restriction system protein
MAIPDYQTIMLSFLQFVADDKEHSLREIINSLVDVFKLNEDERKQLLPSGKQAVFDNRVGWATTYLKKAGVVETPKRAIYRITARGREVLNQKPDRVDVKFLEQFKEFKVFREGKGKPPGTDTPPKPSGDVNPEELFESAYKDLQETLAFEILETIKTCSPEFFERLVIDVLIEMGYGGSRREAGAALGRSGDEGIDGIIKEDKLGLDIIYLQAKRWDKTTVGRPEIQKFAGALLGQAAKKGIFITTSKFSREAEDYVKGLDAKIILIDGERLAELMIEYNVGVDPTATYEIKKIDSDYFIED